MNGDHACAEAAIAAGCSFFAGYPITPSTEIAERLSRRLPQTGGVFIQMEDELGSIAAILGASCAGARAMTATSGPGFSLMTENLGLGIMLEIPLVLVNVQRGSPSTGLPTLPGQSDVMQAKWGSHGDYELAAYSPWSPQEMFDLTVHAFNVADRFRVPVIILADEVVGHMVERVVIPTKDQIPTWERKRPAQKPGDPFSPFLADEEDLVPPMAHAGEGYRIHYTGLTHDEQGYPDMSPDTHHRLVVRLMEKIQRNKDQLTLIEEHWMEGARVAVIAFGSTARSARRAVKDARAEGIAAGFIRLISLWPFPEEKLLELTRDVDEIIVAEMNLGQIVHQVNGVVSLPVTGVHHAGGAMMKPESIIEKIREVAKRGSG
jgi:2-oxoglutarate ferredoxin oxidoreductase subunit alpha